MVSENFLELVTKELSAEISQEERIELTAFINSDDSYRQLYKEYVNYWNNNETEHADDAAAFERIKTRINILEGKEVENKPEESIFREPGKIHFLKYWQKIAIVLALIISSAIVYKNFVASPDEAELVWQEKQTKKGVKLSITLSDGTRIYLNSKSRIRFPEKFSGTTREVFLYGEAYFDVKKDPGHPFIIHTEKMNVKVLGTTFNVKAYPEDVLSETTLISGSVEVTMADRPSDRIILKPKEKLVLKNPPSGTTANKKDVQQPRQKELRASNTGTQFTLTSMTYLHNRDTSSIETSWVQNKLVFKNKPFTDLATQMERWFGCEIRFKSEKHKDLRFTASFEKETLTQVLDALKLTEDFNYKTEGPIVYIY